MQLEWSTTAKNNLLAIEEYISQDNPLAAKKAIDKILTSIKRLKHYPLMGRRGRVEGTRELIISKISYIVPYLIENNKVHILRVLHSSRQWPEEF